MAIKPKVLQNILNDFACSSVARSATDLQGDISKFDCLFYGHVYGASSPCQCSKPNSSCVAVTGAVLSPGSSVLQRQKTSDGAFDHGKRAEEMATS